MQDVSVVQWLRDEIEKITTWLPPEADTRALREALDAVENTLLCTQESPLYYNDVKCPSRAV